MYVSFFWYVQNIVCTRNCVCRLCAADGDAFDRRRSGYSLDISKCFSFRRTTWQRDPYYWYRHTVISLKRSISNTHKRVDNCYILYGDTDAKREQVWRLEERKTNLSMCQDDFCDRFICFSFFHLFPPLLPPNSSNLRHWLADWWPLPCLKSLQ